MNVFFNFFSFEVDDCYAIYSFLYVLFIYILRVYSHLQEQVYYKCRPYQERRAIALAHFFSMACGSSHA